MVVPVIVLLPSASLVPAEWHAYDAKAHAPTWWDPPLPVSSAGPASASESAAGASGLQTLGRSGQVSRRKPSRSAAESDDPNALFGVREVMETAQSAEPAARASQTSQASQAGSQTTGGQQSASQDQRVSPATASLGARIVASARLAGQRQFARRAPDDARVIALVDGLVRAGGKVTVTEAARIAGEPAVRMSGYLAQVARLLNVDGYRVIGITDEGRTVQLNIELLRQQFLDPA